MASKRSRKDDRKRRQDAHVRAYKAERRRQKIRECRDYKAYERKRKGEGGVKRIRIKQLAKLIRDTLPDATDANVSRIVCVVDMTYRGHSYRRHVEYLDEHSGSVGMYGLKRVPSKSGLSIVQQLVRPKFKRAAKEYFALYRSRKIERRRLDEKAINHVIRELRKGRRTSHVAEEMGVSQRRVQQLWAEFRDTGRPHVPQGPGRSEIRPSREQIDAVLDACREEPAGVARTAKYVRNMGTLISYGLVYKIMREHGMVTPSAAKSRRRKWVRYERRYSNAMWHVDWHAMKDQRFHGYNLITYLDDASRCVVAAAVFAEATSENAVAVLRQAIREFGAPATMLSDNGSCFVGVRRKAPTKSWTPTAFEAELLDRGIELINARPYHPQTNGKLERFHRTLEEELHHFGSLSEFIAYYNERRLHWSLDIDNGETPLQAFHNKKVPDAIRKSDSKWMERDTSD